MCSIILCTWLPRSWEWESLLNGDYIYYRQRSKVRCISTNSENKRLRFHMWYTTFSIVYQNILKKNVNYKTKNDMSKKFTQNNIFCVCVDGGAAPGNSFPLNQFCNRKYFQIKESPFSMTISLTISLIISSLFSVRHRHICMMH